jgi:hypothetical protein
MGQSNSNSIYSLNETLYNISMTINTVKNIRAEFIKRYSNSEFVQDKTGVKTVEIVNASFLADEDAIFGTPNQEYIKREIDWYNSMSLNVADLDPHINKQITSY